MSDMPGTRERLLEAAIRIIEADGEVAVRVDVVSEMAGVTKPSLYHFFGDREGLIVATQGERYRRSIRFGLEELLAAIDACRSTEDFIATIEAAVRSFGMPDGARRRAVRVEVLGSAVTRPALRAEVVRATREMVRDNSQVFQIALDRGFISPRFTPLQLGQWWNGLILSRHLVEIDTEVDPVMWDEISIACSRFLLDGMSDERRDGS